MSDAKTMKLSEVATAIGVNPKAMVQWLDRYNLRPKTPRQWARFTLADVAIFSMVARLVRFGVTAPNAYRIASEHAGASELFIWKVGKEWYASSAPPSVDAFLTIRRPEAEEFTTYLFGKNGVIKLPKRKAA